jgi:hypothetical protein
MNPFDPNSYAPAITELLSEPRVPPLDAGTPNRKARSQLDGLSSDDMFAPRQVRDRAMADACRAGLWLFHDFLDEAHTIAQNLHTPTGSYWHAVMHRREADFDNAKYWFRRVGVHPIYEPLRQAAADLAGDAPEAAAFLRTQAAWDPFAFVDLCAASITGRVPCDELCREIQRREWELLFDWCYRQAIEAGAG